MKRRSFLLALLLAFSLVGTSFADFTVDPWFQPQNSDLGEIASDGAGGRQIQIRPLEAEDVGQQWKFFPPHDWLPQVYPEPTPATPAQADILLKAGDPLVLVLPQLQHFPFGADVAVSHSLSGHEIDVDAAIHWQAWSTDTIYGPHEYLHPLGSLAAGQYHLALTFLWSSEIGSTGPFVKTGYVDFVVQAVPEPSAVVIVGVAGLGLLAVGRAKVR